MGRKFGAPLKRGLGDFLVPFANSISTLKSGEPDTFIGHVRKETTMRKITEKLRRMMLLIGTLGFAVVPLAQHQCGMSIFDGIEPGVPGEVSVTLLTDNTAYSVGEKVKMTLTVKNETDKPVTLTFNDGQIYDFTVKNLSRGTRVWRWSTDKAFTEAIWSMTLAPGEEKSYSETWDQKGDNSLQVDPGVYLIEANLSCQPEIFANLVQIRIEKQQEVIKDFTNIDKGFFSGYTERASLVIKDRNAWAQTWGTHTKNIAPSPKLPEVDFSTYMIIAVSRGQFPTSGYSTEIARVAATEGKLIVTVVERDNPAGIVLDVLTQPYHIIKLEKSDLPVEFIYKKERW